MSKITKLLLKLSSCPLGIPGWKKYEDICIKILNYLFVPPLTNPKIQKGTYSGIDKRDAVYPNRNFNKNNVWNHLLNELNARMILFEFKNYDKEEIGKDEVNQIRNYLKQPMGRLAILCCNKEPNKSAYIKRNTIYSDEKIVIIFITNEHLKEMLYIKERGEDPADLLLDLIELFYLEHE